MGQPLDRYGTSKYIIYIKQSAQTIQRTFIKLCLNQYSGIEKRCLKFEKVCHAHINVSYSSISDADMYLMIQLIHRLK